jgi:hypothetical protein
MISPSTDALDTNPSRESDGFRFAYYVETFFSERTPFSVFLIRAL